MTPSIKRDELIGLLRARRRAHWIDIEIQNDSVQAIRYRDVLELYLALSRVRNWHWSDISGGVETRQSLILILLNLVRDGVAYFPLYLNQVRRVNLLANLQYRTESTEGNPCAVFLRTDHWFNIRGGGSVGHLRGVIDGLRALSCRTHVVSSDHLVGVEENSDFHLCPPHYELGRNLPLMSELVYNSQVVSFVRKHWKMWSPTFIYQRYSLGNYAGAWLKANYHVPYVCEYNGSFPWMARHWDKRKLPHEQLITRIELLNLKSADVVVVNSDAMAKELCDRDILQEKILVNPNGVDPDQYSPSVDGSLVRERYGLNGKTVIGFIGTFGPWHGAEILAAAFGKVIRDTPAYRGKIRLLLIGDGSRMSQVKGIIREYGVEECCVCTGMVPQEQGALHLAACDILASPHVPNPDGSPFFGSPTKLFEYMAAGKGIVASELDQIGEILRHNITAWMVKPGDIQDLAAGLKVLVDDPGLTKRLGQAARDEVIAEYTWSAHTKRVLDKLRERI